VLRGQSKSWDAVDSVYRFRRPRTTEQVIHPRKFAIGEGAAPVAPPNLRPRLKGWRRLRRTSLGEFDVQMLLALNDARRPAGAAAGWGGGHFELWRRPAGECRAPCIRADLAWLRVRWDTAADRAQGEAAFRQAFTKRARRGGAIVVAGGGLQTTVVFAPDRRLAAAALAAG